MPSFLYSELKAAVNGRLHNKIALLADARQTLNNVGVVFRLDN